MAAVVEIKIIGSDESRSALASVQTGLHGIGEAASSASSQGSGFFSNMLSAAGGFLAANVIGGITSQFGSLVSGMISGNAQFETYQTQFGVLLGSADAAKQRLADLAAFGAKTPFELPEVVAADKVLTAFGLDTEDTAKRFGVSAAQIRTTIGDAASGAGVSFEELANTFGKFASGSTGEAISRLQELGIATREQMASWGLEFSKSGQLLTPAAEAFTVLEAHVRQKYGGMMDAQSATFSGMLSNLQDWVVGTLRVIGAPIFEVLKDKLGALLTVLGSPEVQASIGAFADSLATGIGQAISFVTQAIDQLQGAWGTLQGLFSSNDSVATGLSTLSGIFQQFGSIAQSAFDAIVQGVQQSGPAIESGLSAYSSIASTLGGVFQSVLGIVSTVLSQVNGFIQAHGAEVVAVFASTWSAVQTTVAALVSALASIIQPILANIQAFISAHGAEIGAFFAATWQQIGQIVQTAMALIRATIVPALQAIGGFISSHGAEIQAILSGAWTVVSTVISTVLSTIQGVLKAALQIIQGDWSGAWETIKQTCATIVQGILTIIQTTLSTLASVFSGALQAAQDAVQGFVGSFASAGGNLVRGMIDGVKSAAAGLASAAAEAARQALDAAKNALGIHSPSRVAADEVGKPFMQGIAKGMEDSFGLVRSMARQLSKQLTDDMNKAAADLAAAFKKAFQDGLQANVDLDQQKLRNLQSLDDLPTDNADAAQKRLDAVHERIVDARQVLIDKLADLDERAGAAQQDRDDKLREAQQSRRDKLAEVTSSKGTDEEKGKKRAQIEADYLKKQSDIQEAYDKKAGDLAKQRSSAEASAKQKIVDLLAEQAQLENDLAHSQQQDAANQELARRTREQLAQAETEAKDIEARTGDSAQAAKYFQLRSQQILQLADLQQEINKAQAEGDNERHITLVEQYAQAQKLQQSQLELFEATKSDKSPYADLLKDLTGIQTKLKDELALDQERMARITDPNKRAKAKEEVDADIAALAQIQTLIAQVNGQATAATSTATSPTGGSTPGTTAPGQPSDPQGSTVTNFNLTIQSSAPTENIIADFQMMQAMLARS